MLQRDIKTEEDPTSSEIFRQLTENIREVFWMALPDLSRVLYVNPAYEELWGQSARRLYENPMAWLEAVHPDEREKICRRARENIHLRDFTNTYRIVRPDGSIRWIRDRSFPIRDSYGNVVRVAGIAEDITELKLVEKRLQDNESRLRMILDGAAEGIYGLDAQGRITFCNAAMLGYLGYERSEDLTGRHVLSVVHSSRGKTSEASARDCPVLESIRMGQVIHRKKQTLWRADGSSFPAEYWCHPIFRDGEVAGAVVSMLDISQKCQAEEALNSSQDQLRQAQKMEAIGRLAGGVAHDFNNLLSVIIGYSEMILDRLETGAPYRSEISEIRAAGVRAADLTRQLLAFSRRQLLQPRLIDLATVVQGVEKMLRRLIGEDVELITALKPCGSALVDPGQMEQVILNLAVNARDAMPSGGKIVIETGNVEIDEIAAQKHACAPGRYVVLAVSDNGCGMSPEVRARLFEPFFTTKPQGKGTGLGLSTVHGIVSQSGGCIWVYSEPGKGTTFKVCFPLVDAVADARPLKPAAPLRKGSETVLLVEDETTLRALARQALKSQGYTVLAAPCGEEAILIAESYPGRIDLVVTDVVMPGLSGSETVARLTALRPGLRVLYMSGYTDDAVVHLHLIRSGSNFLQKPFTPSLLAVKVREALDVPIQEPCP